MNKKAVAKKKTTEVATAPTDDGYGNNLSNDDLILPRIELLQALSPCVAEGNGTAGKLVNNVTKEEYPEPLKIIPVYLTKNWIRWIPRSEGGGMLWKSSDPSDERVVEESKWNGTEPPLATAYFNYLCIIEGEDMPTILSFCNISYQTGRKLYTMTRMTPGPIYAGKYVVSSKKRTNNKGTFYVFDVVKAGPSTEEEQKLAKVIGAQFSGKDFNFTHEQADTVAEEDADEF